MSHFLSRLLPCSLMLLAGLAPAASLQAAPAAPSAPKIPAIDPAAKATLDAVVAAHKAVTAMTGTISIQSTGGGGQSETQTLTLAFQKPGWAKTSLTDKNGLVSQAATDGKTRTVYMALEKKYIKDTMPSGPAALLDVLGRSGSLLAFAFARPEMLGPLLTQPRVQVAPGPTEIIGGVSCDTVTVTMPGAGGVKVTLTLAFGTDDHLLRQITETVPMTAGQMTHTETMTSLMLTPTLTAADFTFTPPAGAKKVASLEPPMHDPRLVPGAKPFPITATDLQGQPLSLEQYKGKVVLMDFWATWCGPCVGEMPNVIAAYKKYHAQGFDVVGISLDQDKTALTTFLRQNKMPWRQVYDGKGWGSAVPHQYGVMAIPFGLLLNRDGTIAAVEVRGPALADAVKQALARKS